MKRIAVIVMICMVLSSVCIAEENSTDRFLNDLSETWNAFLDMANDAGKGIGQWAEDSGVTQWVEGAANDVSKWAQESGITDWADETLGELTKWYDESGLAEWTAEASQNIQKLIDENGPAVETWLAQAGQEVRKAWDTLLYPEQHSDEELQDAYETVTEALEETAEAD